MAEPSRTSRTYFYERWRAISSGIIEAAGGTFLLLIAVRWFSAGSVSKGLLAAGASIGLLLSPVVVFLVCRWQWPSSKAAARLLFLGGAAFLLAAAWPVLPVFVLCSIVGVACSAASIPLFTQMYQENYPEEARGRLFSRTVMIRILTAAVFSKFAGDILAINLEHFRILLLIFSAALFFAGFCVKHCPTEPLHSEGSAHPFRALRFAKEDRLFRQTLIVWMLMGFANLMMLPLRVEYLANPKYQQGLSVSLVAFVTGVVPNLARLVMSPIWGYLFDHMNFFILRITLNLGFAIGILTFFISNSFSGLILGAVIYGISNAGGDVAWSLWVTKFAPANRVADYMSVHTFFTGIRGVIAPLCGFALINHLSLTALGIISSALILAGTLLLIPEIKFGRKAPPKPALVEEISE